MMDGFSKDAYGFAKGQFANGISQLTKLVRDGLSEKKFEDWLAHEEKNWHNKTKDDPIDAKTIRLFFKLTYKLASAYLKEQSFNSLVLIPDRELQFGTLPINDYFIQLSFMTQREMKTKETLLLSERETNIIKIRRSLETNSQMDKDYINQYEFEKVDNLLVLGNPGVGKTTFAKWFCHRWGKNPAFHNCTPIYVELKRLKFGARNAILEYLFTNYWPAEFLQLNDVHALFKRLPEQFLFILDGYDELTEENKRALYQSLLEISSNAKYLLTSRPYGVLETYGLTFRKTIQLNGFSVSNIHNYIARFVETSRIESKTAEQLIDIIRLNPTLTDFAHNPLLLSFMVFIYLSDEKASETLKKIESRYALQEKVVDWMFCYHRQKGVAVFTDELSTAASKLAYDMELQKAVDKDVSGDHRLVETVMKPLAVCGLGQLTNLLENNTRFYFNSITFQEYFAAQYLAGKITTDAFDYLMKDSYFWNLGAMIVGYLNQSPTLRLSLDKLIDQFGQQAGEIRHSYSFYRYLLMISECRHDYINEKLTSDRLSHLFEAYCTHADDEQVRFGLSECLQRIYSKLLPEKKSVIKDAILKILQQTFYVGEAEEDPLTRWNEEQDTLIGLINYLGLETDFQFADSLTELVTEQLRALQQGEVEESAYVTTPSYILHVLRGMPVLYFELRQEQLLAVANLVPHEQVYDRVNITMMYRKAIDIIDDLKGIIKTYTRAIEKAKAALAGQIAIGILGAGLHADEVGEQVGFEPASDIILKGIELLIKDGWGEAFSDEVFDNDDAVLFSSNQLIQMSVEGLLQFRDHSRLYMQGIELVYSSGDIEWEFNGNDILLIRTYILRYLSADKKIPSALRIISLCRLFSQSQGIKNLLLSYRTRLMDLVSEFINENYKTLVSEELMRFVNSGAADIPDPNNAAGDKFDLLLDTLHTFHQMLDEGEMYASDRQYFIEEMLRRGFYQMDIYGQNVLPQLMFNDYILTDNAWQYIFSALNDPPDVKEQVLRIFNNTSIYDFWGNYDHLKKLVVYFNQWRREDGFERFLDRCKEDMLLVISECLIMLKRIPFRSENEVFELTALVGPLLDLPLIKKLVANASPGIDGRTMTAFIMQYYFTGKESDDLHLDYDQLLLPNEKSLAEILSTLYDLFAVNGILNKNEVAKIKKVTGDKLINKLVTYADHQLTFNYPFNPGSFNALLNNDNTLSN